MFLHHPTELFSETRPIQLWTEQKPEIESLILASLVWVLSSFSDVAVLVGSDVALLVSAPSARKLVGWVNI